MYKNFGHRYCLSKVPTTSNEVQWDYFAPERKEYQCGVTFSNWSRRFVHT